MVPWQSGRAGLSSPLACQSAPFESVPLVGTSARAAPALQLGFPLPLDCKPRNRFPTLEGWK